MDEERIVITETGFLTDFLNQHTQRTERSFCFILGAGASRSSGIMTGSEMASVWLREVFDAENFDTLSLEEWATPERLEIKDFKLEHLASFYPELYRRKYSDNEQGGYAFLESQMEGKEPSYGYSVLSYLLSETSHRVVVTTNFDNLVADALSIHSSIFPLVIGHDALAQYAAVELRRPLVAKIHGALGFSPKSQPSDLSKLPEGWSIALRRILDRYTPIVIGYEGNDGSLMGFLKSLPPEIPDRVFWCVYAPDAMGVDCLDRVSPEVRDYVKRHRGRFVPIRGFDELMAKLLTKLREKGTVPDLLDRLKVRARERELNYEKQQDRLVEGALKLEPGETGTGGGKKTDTALSRAVSEIGESRKDKPWWSWFQEAKAAPDRATNERILLQGVEALPNSAPMLRSYAVFLSSEESDLDKAQTYYQRAFAVDPKDYLTLAFYGDFLDRHRGDADQAEAFFQRALEAKPDDDYILTRYADFLDSVRGERQKAEDLYERALKLHPNYDYLLRAYPKFLRGAQGNEKKAEELEQRLQVLRK